MLSIFSLLDLELHLYCQHLVVLINFLDSMLSCGMNHSVTPLVKKLSKSLLTWCQLISEGVGTNDDPFRKSDFCGSDSSVAVKLIAFWSGAVSLILTIFYFCLSLLFLLLSFNLARICFREPPIFLFKSFYN